MKIAQTMKTVSRFRVFHSSRRSHLPSLTAMATLATIGLTMCLASSAHAGTWQMTVTSTNSNGTTGGTGLTSIATSIKTTLVVAEVGGGSTSTTLSGQATASYSGTYTFQWMPSGPSDWPSAYIVTSIRNENHTSSMLAASGAVSTATTSSGSSGITLPGTYSTSTSFPSAPTTSVDTSVTNLTVTTTTLSKSYTVVDSGGAVTSNSGNITLVTRAYNSAYFPANFSTPASVVLTYSVSAASTQANCSYSSSTAASIASASATIGDIFFGQ